MGIVELVFDGPGELPTTAHEGDVGFDLRSFVDVGLPPGKVTKISTGIRCVSFREDHNKDVFPEFKSRSGLASRGIFVVGGVIDKEYKGEWCVLLFNSTDQTYNVSKGDKIAQMVLVQIVSRHHEIRKATPNESFAETDTSSRGASGFGSTGR